MRRLAGVRGYVWPIVLALAVAGHLEESFDDMARDLARFLMRLSKGEAPTK